MKNSNWTKVLVIVIIGLFIGVNFVQNILGLNIEKNEDRIIKEIQTTQDKILIVNRIIGDRNVSYWEHVVNGFYIKNDSILLHTDVKTGEILEYEKNWREINCNITSQENHLYIPTNYYWKKPVIFLNKDDCTYFYTLNDIQEYPISCWEVRYTNGSTIMYTLTGETIGFGVPAPSQKGFTMSGDCNDDRGDCWYMWRHTAYNYFNNWTNQQVINKEWPLPSEISSFVQDPEITFFYEIAHGSFTYFQPGIKNIYYYSSMLKNDMKNRPPIKFAFIGSCDGMKETGSVTFSYEFRKGLLNGTVTIGYSGMADCPGWVVSLQWQNKMFEEMDSGKTIKNSFDYACSYYPLIADCVKFVGDAQLKINDNPPNIPDINGDSSRKINELTEYTTTSYDPDGDEIYFMLDWDDGTNSGWFGPFFSGENCIVSHFWDETGNYEVKAKAKDANGLENNVWSSLIVSVIKENSPPNAPIIIGPAKGTVGSFSYYDFMAIDVEGNQVYYFIDWGDSTNLSWGPCLSGVPIRISHIWSTKGAYTVKAKAIDIYNDESDWATLRVKMPYSYNKPLLQFLELLFQRFPNTFPLLQKRMG